MQQMMARSLEIVVSHHNEDLSWLTSVNEDCIVYSKGAPPAPDAHFKACRLPNIGREGHTYLHHVVTRYSQLADVTLFVQGRIDDHIAWSIDEMKKACLKMDEHHILTFPSTDSVSTELVRFDEWDGIKWDSHPCLAKWAKMDMRNAALTPAEYFSIFFGQGRIPVCVGYTSGAVFAVPRRLIHARTLDFYHRLMDAMFLGSMEHVNPETGFYMERFWLAMWQPEEYICESDADVAQTERNSQGQLAKGRWRPLPKISIPSHNSNDRSKPISDKYFEASIQEEFFPDNCFETSQVVDN
ncbi:hypothetical protein MFRU_002g00400 [Monilinia fructicola]|nr:hypothetical protein MFRU_002g00400 [Monilinia fructicola]